MADPEISNLVELMKVNARRCYDSGRPCWEFPPVGPSESRLLCRLRSCDASATSTVSRLIVSSVPGLRAEGSLCSLWPQPAPTKKGSADPNCRLENHRVEGSD